MKKVAKASLIGLCCLCPIALITSFATNWKHQIVVSCVGSSGVKPFIELLSNSYADHSYDITVEAGGSGFGIDELAKKHCNIGTSSTNPYTLVNNNEITKKIWKNNMIKTITFGWEAICLIYKLPSSLSENTIKSFEISINERNVDKLFSVFSGFKSKDSEINWKDFINDENWNQFDVIDQTFLKQSTMIPYVRSGGNTTSGTAAAFCLETHFENFNFENLDPNQKKAFISGQYGNDYEMYQTDEANSRSWDMFCKNDIPGSMIYLSSGFVETNIDLIKKHGYKIAQYNNINYTIENVKNRTYKWFRPINCSFSLEDEKVKKVINGIIANKEINQQILTKKGGIFVSDKEIESMFPNNEWLSDAELEKIRSENNKKTYGAIAFD